VNPSKTRQNRGLVILASYPKSGNTWVRALISGLVRSSSEICLDSLEGKIVSHAHPLVCPFPPSNMTLAEADHWHADACLAISDPVAKFSLLKTHTTLRKDPREEWIFPRSQVLGAVHVVRHPFDVLPSLANHLSKSIPEALEYLLKKDTAMGGRKGRLREFWGSWSQHTRSWMMDIPPFPILRVRYEDLKTDTVEELRRVAEFIGGFDLNPEALQRATAAAKFERLQEQEQEKGFRETPSATKSFFRKGQSGEGWDALSDEQRTRIFEACRAEMDQLGYSQERPK